MYTTVCLCDRELQMRFSPFETFYPRHVQRPITLAVEYLHNFYTVGKINTSSFQWYD